MKKTLKFTAALMLLLMLSAFCISCASMDGLNSLPAARAQEGEETGDILPEVTEKPEETEPEKDQDDPEPVIEDYEIAFKTPSSYDPNAEHGKKAMYGVSRNKGYVAPRLDIWENGYFGYADHWIVFHDMTNAEYPHIVCYDPDCMHEDETCPAYYVLTPNHDDYYTSSVFVDYYDDPGQPVFYSIYCRYNQGVLAQGKAVFNRSSGYVIQRYDPAIGRRETVGSGISDYITSSYTYGDHIFYVASPDYQTYKNRPDDEKLYYLALLPKAGGETLTLCPENAHSLEIVYIDDNSICYMVNDRYIYRCSYDLKAPELIFDFDGLEKKVGMKVVPAQFRGGYIYCFTNLKNVVIYGDDHPDLVGDCYRLPIDNMNEKPVLLAENMLLGGFYRFSDNYLFWQPVNPDGLDRKDGEFLVCYAGGVIKSTDLFTGETKECMNEPEVIFWLQHVIGDDITTLSQGCTKEALTRGWDDTTFTKIYKVNHDGGKYTVWEDLVNGKRFRGNPKKQSNTVLQN